MFKKPFSFRGRIRRTEYVLSIVLVYVIIYVVANIITSTNLDGEILIIFFIPIYWFIFAQGAKRCHDRGNSGWFQIIPFYNLWMLFADSETGENQYGQNPKGIGNYN